MTKTYKVVYELSGYTSSINFNECGGYAVQDGYLNIYKDRGLPYATFAPGNWRYVSEV